MKFSFKLSRPVATVLWLTGWLSICCMAYMPVLVVVPVITLVYIVLIAKIVETLCGRK